MVKRPYPSCLVRAVVAEGRPRCRPRAESGGCRPDFENGLPPWANRAGSALEGLREWAAEGSELSVPRRVEIGVVALLTLAALFLRAWNLDGAPNGVHGDETEMALEALRSIHGGDLGIWTGATLGHPAGYAPLDGADFPAWGCGRNDHAAGLGHSRHTGRAGQLPTCAQPVSLPGGDADGDAACVFALVRDSEPHRVWIHHRSVHGNAGDVAGRRGSAVPPQLGRGDSRNCPGTGPVLLQDIPYLFHFNLGCRPALDGRGARTQGEPAALAGTGCIRTGRRADAALLRNLRIHRPQPE